MVYGMPRSLDDIESYYQHIMHRTYLSPEVLESGNRLFRLYGVADPLTSVTLRQMKALQRHFDALVPDANIRVYSCAYHTKPFIDETVHQIIDDGAESLAVLPMSTLYSKTGIGKYLRLVRRALRERNSTIAVTEIVRWYRDEAFIEALAERLRMAWEWLPMTARVNGKVIFTVHSKPGKERVHREYIEQFQELAELVAERALPSAQRRWRTAYRSGGPPSQVWLGPDLLDCIREEAMQGTTGIVTCDLLSVTENVEVLNDIGTEAQALTRSCGMEFARTEFLNDADDFMTALSRIVLEQWGLLKTVETK